MMKSTTPKKIVSKSPSSNPFPELKNYDELVLEYDLSPEDRTLRQVMHRIGDRLDTYQKILLQILQPEEFSALYESQGFNEQAKTHILELYKKIIILDRQLLYVYIEGNSQAMRNTIIATHTELLTIKPQLLEVIANMKESWTSIRKKGNVGYVG